MLPNECVASLVRAAMERIRHSVRDRTGFQTVSGKHAGAPGRQIDVVVEQMYLDGLADYSRDISIVSEESGVIGDVNEYHYSIFIDPVDGTELAVHDTAIAS